MAQTPAGWLVAEVDAATCNACRVCVEVCPGRHLRPGLLPPQLDPFEGPIEAAYTGRACERQLLDHAQSGGVVTAVLEHLLNSGEITEAVVSQMPEDGSLRPQPISTADAEQVRRAGGSKYCPIPVAGALPKQPEGNGTRTALVALACHVHGIRNAQRLLKDWRDWDPLIGGLICQGVLSFLAMDHLIGRGGVARERVLSYRFRSKQFHGWPGDGSIRTREGTDKCVPKQCRLRCKSTFTPNYCRLCFDKMNVLADLVLGDAWGLCDDKAGTSVVLARTRRGRDALEATADAGTLTLRPVSPEDVFRGQGLQDYRRDWAAYMAASKATGQSVPDFGIESRWHPPIDGVSLKPYRKQLEWARALAAAETPDRAARAASRHLLIGSFTRGLSRLASVRRIGASLVRRLQGRLGKVDR